VCGEERLKQITGLAELGTPPRVWGRANCRSLQDYPRRDTPTCVGKSIADTAYTNTG